MYVSGRCHLKTIFPHQLNSFPQHLRHMLAKDCGHWNPSTSESGLSKSDRALFYAFLWSWQNLSPELCNRIISYNIVVLFISISGILPQLVKKNPCRFVPIWQWQNLFILEIQLRYVLRNIHTFLQLGLEVSFLLFNMFPLLPFNTCKVSDMT